jgi:hypothetical protein
MEIELNNPSEALQDSIRSCPKLRIDFVRDSDYGYSSGVFKVYKVLTVNEINSVKHYHDKIKEYTNFLISRGGTTKLLQITNPFVILEVSKSSASSDIISYLFVGHKELNTIVGKLPLIVAKTFTDVVKNYTADMETVFTKSDQLKGAFELLENFKTFVDAKIMDKISKFFVTHEKEWNSFFKGYFLKSILEFCQNKPKMFTVKELDDFVTIFANESVEYSLIVLTKSFPSGSETNVQIAKLLDSCQIWSAKKFKLSTEQSSQICKLFDSNPAYRGTTVWSVYYEDVIVGISNSYPLLALDLAKRRTEILKAGVKANTYKAFHTWLRKLIEIFAKAGALGRWNSYFNSMSYIWRTKKTLANRLKDDLLLDPSKHVNVVQPTDEEVIELD